ncbi:hypothetical protein C8R46DRAFT_1356215 [Mycena filopes]|nr:hypothetical protein C8R46DRAFT_1356215 [Mycena filopes]
MKLSSSIVLSFALQLFLADLVLAQTSSLSQAFTTFNSVPMQTGLANSYHDPGDNSDSGDATWLFPTRCLACPIPSSSASLLASSSTSSLTASPSSTSSGGAALINSPPSDPSPTFPAFSTTTILTPSLETSSETSASNNNTDTTPAGSGSGASQLRTQVVIGLIVGLALLGGLAAVIFLLLRRSKRRNSNNFAVDVEAALPFSSNQKGGFGYAHSATVNATAQPGNSESDSARKIAELEAQGRRMQDEIIALRRRPHSEAEFGSTKDYTVNHAQCAKFDIFAARARETNREPEDGLPCYKQFDSESVQ